MFVYGLPYDHKLYIHAFTDTELLGLTTRTKLTYAGRFYAYKHLQVGDQKDNIGVLIPKEIVRTVGKPFKAAITDLSRLLTQEVATLNN